MGLGSKIKEVLKGDEHEHQHAEQKSHAMPGAFESDEIPERHSDGKPYIAPSGSLIGHGHGRKDTATDTTGAGPDATTAGTHPHKLHKGVDDYAPSREGTTASKHSGQTADSGVGLGGHSSARDQAPQGGAYWGDLSSSGHGQSKDLPERSAVGGHPTTAASGHHGHGLGDQAVGGGVYNSVTGHGSPEHTGTRAEHAGGITGDLLSSGSKGIGVPAGYRYEEDPSHLRGDGAPTSRSDHTGAGLVGAGTAAGAAGVAGYAAHEHGQHGQGKPGYGASQQSPVSGSHAPGVPHSTMLEPERAPAQTTSRTAGLPSSTAQGGSGGFGGGPAAATGVGAGATPSSASSHFGPGHEGSKVLHTCEHCGRDNDISRYFKKDVVYRLGS